MLAGSLGFCFRGSLGLVGGGAEGSGCRMSAHMPHAHTWKVERDCRVSGYTAWVDGYSRTVIAPHMSISFGRSKYDG
jgi:hypothetical protein